MTTGIALAFVAAVFLGVFALPTKFIRDYAWENTWGAFFLVGMFVVPIGFTVLSLDGLAATYAAVPTRYLVAVILLGFLWGCSHCCWGYAIATIGMSLGFSVLIGTVILSGSILPFLMGNADRALTAPGLTILGGIAVCLLGVVANGIAGLRRERAQAQDRPAERKSMAKGLLVCFAGGLLAAGCNLAFHVGSNVAGLDRISAQQFGNPPYLAGLSVWMLAFIGAGVANCGYCAFLLSRNKTWGRFAAPGSGRNLGLASLMALSHFACLFFYGLSAWKLGALGTSVGFAIFETLSIIVANGLGLLTGEWKGATRDSLGWMAAGLAVLVLGIVIISIGNALMAAPAV